MKKALTLVLFVIASVCLPSELLAQKCKYALDKADAMTGAKMRRTSLKLERYLFISFYVNGDDYRVELNLSYVGERNFVVPEGNELMIKLTNGEIFNLASVGSASPTSYVAGTQVATDYAISYRCSTADMKRIADAGIAVFRVTLGDETTTYEVKKNDIPETAQKAGCILAQ